MKNDKIFILGWSIPLIVIFSIFRFVLFFLLPRITDFQIVVSQSNIIKTGFVVQGHILY